MSAQTRDGPRVPGGPNSGIAYYLSQIDPDTLPERDCWDEVRRRIAAAERGADGWRTGEIETTLADFQEGEHGRD
ncbi:hypothetical protein ACOJIV_25040 [Haloarcula sp. AONF1]